MMASRSQPSRGMGTSVMRAEPTSRMSQQSISGPESQAA